MEQLPAYTIDEMEEDAFQLVVVDAQGCTLHVYDEIRLEMGSITVLCTKIARKEYSVCDLDRARISALPLLPPFA